MNTAGRFVFPASVLRIDTHRLKTSWMSVIRAFVQRITPHSSVGCISADFYRTRAMRTGLTWVT